MKSRPQIYVTGLLNSGTTWMFNLLWRSGYDVGNINDLNGNNVLPEMRKGGEWQPFFKIAKKIGIELFSEEEQYPFLTSTRKCNINNLKSLRDTINEKFPVSHLEFPELVKVPEFGQCFLLDKIKPKHTVVMLRNMEDWVDSVLGGKDETLQAEVIRGGIFAKGCLYYELDRCNLDYTVLYYPKAALDSKYTYKKIKHLLDGKVTKEQFTDIHKKLLNLGWIHWDSEEHTKHNPVNP